MDKTGAPGPEIFTKGNAAYMRLSALTETEACDNIVLFRMVYNITKSEERI
jgi:hypothetical protein